MNILSKLKNKICHKTVYFLDTNILIRREKRSMQPSFGFLASLKGFKTVGANFNELSDKQKRGVELRKRLFRKLKVVNFDDLYRKHNSICPVYYTLISSVYNPANISSEYFLLQLIQSMKLREKTINTSMNVVYQKLMTQLSEMAKSAGKNNGLSLLDKSITISTHKFYKKRINKKQRNSPAAFNDYRSFITAFLYGVINNKNVIFVTTDRDFFTIHRNFVESVAQEAVFKQMILENLSNAERRKILSKKSKVTKFISYKQFKINVDNFIQDMISCNWQKKCTTFSLRYWDVETGQYAKDLVLHIDTMLSEIILNTHSNLSCYSAKNDTHGNWIGYYYWPPTPKNEDTIKLVVYAKKIINKRQLSFSPIDHDKICKYVAGDRLNKMSEATRFWN